MDARWSSIVGCVYGFPLGRRVGVPLKAFLPSILDGTLVADLLEPLRLCAGQSALVDRLDPNAACTLGCKHATERSPAGMAMGGFSEAPRDAIGSPSVSMTSPKSLGVISSAKATGAGA